MAKVLIADERAADRQLLRGLLERMGHAVVETCSADDAFAEAQINKPDLMFSDIPLPGADGFELCRWFQQDPDLRHVPFFFISEAYTAPAYAQFAEDIGAARILPKPVDPQELRHAVRDSLSNGLNAGATQKLDRMDLGAFHRRRADAASSQLEVTLAELTQSTQRYKLLSKINQAIVHSASREPLFQTICRAMVEDGGVQFAAIVLLDRENRHPKLAAWYGEAAGSTTDLCAALDAFDVDERGITREALRTGAPVISDDILNESARMPWHAAARCAGVGSMAVFPLSESGAIVGALEFYACNAGFFNAMMLPTLQEIAADVSFALDNYARVAERDQAIQAVQEAESTYRALIEQSLVGIYQMSDGKVLYQNPRADEIFGYGPGELVGHSIKALVMDDDWPLCEREIARVMSGEIPTVNMDFRARHKDGRKILINAQGALTHRRGQPILAGVLQDVTQLRHSEKEILGHVQKLETAFMRTVEVATALSELRDPYTAGHERRVAEVAVAIGAELGFDERRQQGLRVAGLLHDIGKITIPAEILSKPGRLSAVEYSLVKGHPQASYDVLKNVEFPWPVAQVALQHHERIDGSGYPQGLKGEAIVFEARVMAVADVIEAMASHRPYRAGLGIETALLEIERGRGSAYDSVVVDACLRLFREKGYRLPTD